ncbi:MAG: hypothetical protein RLZZ622_1074, partial [Planctomycetota bacterium]
LASAVKVAAALGLVLVDRADRP